ncbi:MAG: hypothetical protein DSZ24_06145 [Thermodesulfatator sp.]|nr:MAG: hypothetical protein DSZ24_06145 [Thermodesulfatator sp.]
MKVRLMDANVVAKIYGEQGARGPLAQRERPEEATRDRLTLSETARRLAANLKVPQGGGHEG